MKITATRSDDGEFYRIGRLCRFLAFMLGNKSAPQGLDKIISMHDHEGALTVGFENPPSVELCRWIDEMWNETEYEPICRCVYSEERSVDFVEHRFENLSHRLQRALKWEFSVDDDVTPEMAATLTRARFLRIPNIGSKSLNEVNEWLIMNNCKPLI